MRSEELGGRSGECRDKPPAFGTNAFAARRISLFTFCAAGRRGTGPYRCEAAFFCCRGRRPRRPGIRHECICLDARSTRKRREKPPTLSLRTSAAALVWQSVSLALSPPGQASGGPVFFASWPKKTGEKKGRSPFRKLSRQPSHPFAGRGLLGTWEGFDCGSVPAPALARLRGGRSAPSALIQLPAGNRTRCRNESETPQREQGAATRARCRNENEMLQREQDAATSAFRRYVRKSRAEKIEILLDIGAVLCYTIDTICRNEEMP